MAMMVRPAVAERSYHAPRVQSPPPPPRTQTQAQAAADNTYVPVQSFPPPSPSPPLALEYSSNASKPQQEASYYVVAEVVLRILLFVFSLAALLVLLTSKQTVELRRGYPPFDRASFYIKFNTYSPAFKYFVVAVAASTAYSLITTLFAFLNLCIRGSSRSRDLLYQFITTMDVVMLGIVGSASGAATAITYVGLRGNNDLGWSSICDVYDTFCLHIGLSVVSSLLASLILIIIISFSVSSLTHRIASSYTQVRNA